LIGKAGESITVPVESLYKAATRLIYRPPFTKGATRGNQPILLWTVSFLSVTGFGLEEPCATNLLQP
jgi:hypothetical protein